MNKSRQDAWSEEEDIFLAETVIRHISEGKTQLEAFQHVAEGLDRTPAACGFRWNAEIRKDYFGAIQTAKNTRKNVAAKRAKESKSEKEASIDSIITLLERVKSGGIGQGAEGDIQTISQLTEENELLYEKLKRYEDAWREMGKLWQWTHNINKNEH